MSKSVSNTAPSTPKALAEKAKRASKGKDVSAQAPSPTQAPSAQPVAPTVPASALAAALQQAAATPAPSAKVARNGRKVPNQTVVAGTKPMPTRQGTWTRAMLDLMLGSKTTDQAEAVYTEWLKTAELAKGKGGGQCKLGLHWSWAVAKGYVALSPITTP